MMAEDTALKSFQMTEMKQSELYEGNDSLSKKQYTNVHLPAQYPRYEHARSSSFHDVNVQVPTNAYYVAGYRILAVLLAMYCIFGVTYLLFFKNSQDCTCSSVATGEANSNKNDNTSSVNANNPSQSPSIMQYVSEPTLMPSDLPAMDPSAHPTGSSTIPPSIVPTGSPVTLSPTHKPTLQPTTDHGIYDNHVGDFKISAQNLNHSSWLLCDGSFIDSKDYPELFDVIGYAFGSFASYLSLFALPNAMDRVVGITGNTYGIGTDVGNAEITLTQSNMPAHYHLMVYGTSGGDTCRGEYHSTSYPYLADECFYNSGLLTTTDDRYELKGSNNYPNQFHTSTIGSGQAINVINPTSFIGNLFIYAGNM